MRRRLASVLASALATTLLALLPGAAVASAPPASSYRFSAGAGRADTTPPLAGTPDGNAAHATFASATAACPTAAFPSRGRFALQEPFDDLNRDGQWDASPLVDPFCDANANGRWEGIYSDNGPIFSSSTTPGRRSRP